VEKKVAADAAADAIAANKHHTKKLSSKIIDGGFFNS